MTSTTDTRTAPSRHRVAVRAHDNVRTRRPAAEPRAHPPVPGTQAPAPSSPSTGLLTPAGRGVATAAVTLTALAGVLRFVELAILAVACVATLLAAACAVARRARLEARITVVPHRVARGEPAVAQITVSNVERRTVRGLAVRVTHGPTATETYIRVLAAGATRQLTIPLPTGRRGALQVGPLTVRRADPFGLLARMQQIGAATLIHIHPTVHPLTPLPSLRSSSPDGLAVDSSVEGGATFHALREYVPGDDPRRVHWRSSAKAGTLLVRLNVDPSEAVTTVLLDTRAAAYPTGADGEAVFDEAVDAAASVLLASARRRFPVQLRTTGRIRVTGRGGRHDEGTVLDTLAGVTVDSDARGLPETARTLGRGGGGTLALITGPRDAGQLAAVASALGRFEQVVVVRVGVRGVPTRATSAARIRVLEIVDAAGITAAWPTRTGGLRR